MMPGGENGGWETHKGGKPELTQQGNKKNNKKTYTLDHISLSPELQNVRDRLDEYVIGQKEAKNQIVDALARTLMPNPNRKRPIANFLFLGPTGVGKTEVARALFSILLGEDNLDLRETKIDCTTYQSDHEIADLIGSPTGYVGYGDEPRFADSNLFKRFNEARKKGTLHPLLKDFENFSIILFDEIEKASDAVFKLMLGIVDEGVLELKSGKESDTGANFTGKKEIKHSKYTEFKNTIIIMTSNLGAENIQKRMEGKGKMGFFTKQDEGKILDKDFYNEEIKRFFKPEFVGRITEAVPFSVLSKDELHQRLDIEIQRHKKYIGDILAISLTKKASTQLVDNAYESNLGGRNLILGYEKKVHTIISKVITNKSISKLEKETGKAVTQLIVDINPKGEFFVKASMDEVKPEKSFTRRVRENTMELNSDEIIVSIQNNSLIDTIKNVILPNISYLKMLYTYREKITDNYSKEIENIETLLSIYGVPKKDLTRIASSGYSERLTEIEAFRDQIDFFSLWKNDSENFRNNKVKLRNIAKVAYKVTEKNMKFLKGQAYGIGELAKDIENMLVEHYQFSLNEEEINSIFYSIHKRITSSHGVSQKTKEEMIKEVKEERKKEEDRRIEEVKKLIHIKAGTNAKPQVAISPSNNITINLNFYSSGNTESNGEKVKKMLETRANLFQDNYNQVMLAIKQSVDNRENDNDLILVFDEVKEILQKELGKLTSNQTATINSLIQEALKNK